MKLAALSALGIIIGAAIASSTDPCYLVQRLTESGAAVELKRLCGEPPDDVIVVGPAGTRRLLAFEGTWKTAGEVDSEYLPSGRVGIAYRCGPDPDRPGQLNAASNGECCCPTPKTPACAKVVYSCG